MVNSHHWMLDYVMLWWKYPFEPVHSRSVSLHSLLLLLISDTAINAFQVPFLSNLPE